MKLLPEKKVKEKRTSERDLEALRRIEIANRRLRAERENNRLKESYSLEKRKAKKEFDLFMQDLNAKRGLLLHEVEQLERYKRKLVQIVTTLEIQVKQK